MSEKNIGVRKSNISGKGVFAKRNIQKEERICFMKGEEVSDPEAVRRIKKGIENDEDFLQINNKRFIDMQELYRCINHSCSPNAFIRGKNELVALKDIDNGEEITYDYSTTMWENKEEIKKELGTDAWIMKCKCGSKNCRKMIDQFYLLPKKLQKYYVKNKLAPDFILRKFAKK